MAVLIVLLTWLATCSAALTDEMQTFDPACLTEGAFNCFDGGCVPLEKYCDGKYDCKDGSDENFCTSHTPDALYCNDTHQFLCADGRKCVPSVWVCNNETDCNDGSDEYNCSVPLEYDNSTCHGFLCDDNKKCISKFWTCDGYYDCDDKSDEDIKVACRHSLHMQLYASISDCEYRSHRYSCLDNSFCLPQDFMCDGMVDCRDGSDEGPFCENWHTKCDNFTCPKESFCKQHRTGVTCICDSYNVYNETTKKCEETDNCIAERPTCSHMCVDKGDYFKCICDPGYVPDPAGYLCFAPDPEALLFFSTRNDIRYVKVKSKQQVTVLTGIKQAHGVSYDGNYLYWVETAQGHQAIMRAHLQNVEESKQVLMVNTRLRRVLAMSDTNESVPPPQHEQTAGFVLPADVVSGVRTSADATLHASPPRPSPSLHVPFAHGADAPGHVSAIGSKPVDPRSRSLLEVLVYGARGRVLVDTGAKHCIASESLKAHLYKNNHKFVKVRTELKFADGTVKNLVVDTAQVEVTVLDIVVSTLFIVLPGATDFLLGMNFIKDSDSFSVACSTVGLPHDEGTVLKPEERRELSDVLERNQDVFEPGGAPTTLADRRIDPGDHAPDRVTFGTQYLKSCDICKQYKPTNLNLTVLLQTPTPQQRCEVLAMDLFGPLPAESQGEVKWSIGEQQDRRKAVKDQRRRPTARFKEGHLVWVEMHSHSNAEKGVTRKFAPRREGPYKISTAVSPTTFDVIDKEGEVKGKYHASALSLYQGTSRSDAVTLRKRGRPAKSQPPSSGCDLEGEDIANGIQILKDDAIRHPRRTRCPPAAIADGRGLEDPGDIAIDHLGDNIYFSDAERGVISVCRPDGSLCTTLRTNAKTPKFVTLDTRNGQMYWADWHNRAVLMVAQMDGSKSEVLTDSLTTFATGLALDAPNQRLYFVDRTIKVVRLQDRLLYSFFEEPFHHPYSLAVFESTVFWSDWTSDSVQTADKVHGAALSRNILLTLDEPIFDMHIYHPVLMNITHNPCENHKCQICLVTSNVTHVCACPDTMEIVGDHCEHIRGYRAQYVVVGAGAAAARVHYDRVGNPEARAAALDVGRVQAMAYDNKRDTLYIYDSQRKAINAINMSEFSLGVTQLLAHRGLENVVDMDYDYVSDSLYVVDAGRRLVEVISLRNHRSAIVYYFTDQEIPISFCVLPEYGRMLIAVLEPENNNEIHIDSIGLDGKDRNHQLMSNILGPNIRVRYSPEMNVVYISDDGNGIIDIVHPEGTGRENFREVLTTIASLAVTETHVFWTDRRTQRLYWADVHEVSRKIRRIELSIFPNNTNLHIIATSPPPDPKSPLTKHKCYQETTPCSHICVQSSRTANKTAASTDYKCLCPSGYHMFKEICSEVVKCKSNEIYCHKSNDCFVESKRCDGHKDCWYGEDEEGCVASVTQKPSSCPFDYTNCYGNCIPINQICKENTTISLICGPNEFKCSDGSVCVERALACDGRSDCPDGSDEHPAACDTRRCYDTEFMCSSGNCIPATWKCDASADCADGSDEADCELYSESCPEDNYRCSDGTCIKLYKRCDGKYDCMDRDDEDGCDIDEFIETEPVLTCSSGEFACERNKSICLPYTARCNSKVDCPGATDEDGCDLHCETRLSSLFSCKQEYMCINKKHVCNGRKDCTDGSDETLEACAKVNKTAPLHSMFPMSDCSRGYRCDSGQCIEWSQVCDTRPDCIDHSDENGLCETPCAGACPGGCARTPRGPRCAGAGADACAAGACAQRCRSLPGAFVCACYAGYALRPDRRSCKAIGGRPTILYARGASVWSNTNHVHSQVYQNEGEINDLDVDARRDKMYVVSSDAGKLVEVDLSNNASTPDVITNVGRPSKVAVDWVTGNVYFVDSSPAAGCVRVCNFYKKRCARLQRLPSEAEVTALAVDPSHRRLYYCLSRQSESAVRASTLFGRAEPELGAASCRGLALGPAHLYMASVEPDALLRVEYDGSAMSPVIAHNANLNNPHDLAVFEDHAYFLSNSHLKRCLIFGSKTCENYSFMPNTSAFVMKHEVTQVMVDNDCDGITCDNVCVMGDGGALCVCHDGGLASDGVCPFVKSDDLAVFNGVTYQERRAHAVSLGLIAAVLVLFALYIAVFIYYYIIKKKKQAGDYMQVRYHNTPDAMGGGQLTNPIIDMPEAGYVIDGMGHEFVNPLQYVKNIWQESLYKRSKPGDTSGLIFETQDLSDTESDLDVKETRRMVRN
ncbi:unnamed protein product, partial [Brenthis ino]